VYEGTIVAFDWSTKVYGISWDDGDYTANDQAATGSADALKKLVVARKVTGELKAPHVAEWLVDFVNDYGEQVLVFFEHGSVGDTLMAGLKKAGISVAMIRGDTPANQRLDNMRAFQTGQVQVLLGSRAIYAGLNFQNARYVVFAERWWVPTQEEQAEDRVYRIGQNKPVFIYYPHAPTTLDPYMSNLVQQKRDVLAQLYSSTGVQSGLDPNVVIRRLPPAWRAFAAQHQAAWAPALASSVLRTGGDGGADDPDEATGQGSVVARLVAKLKESGACYVEPKHIQAAPASLGGA
jgi:SNF2 family DNA or RNA helicase